MNQRRTILVGAALSVALTVGTACSSAVNGSGSGSSAGSSEPRASAPALGATVIAAPTPAATGSSEPGSVGSSAPAPIGSSGSSAPGGGVSAPPKAKAPAPMSSATSTASTPTAPTSPPVIKSFDYTITDHTGCAVNGNVQVTLSWTSSSATHAYLAPSQTATPFDAKGATGATGPLAPNGSTQVSFPCAESYYYFDLSVHNSIGLQYESTQIENPYAPSS